MTGHPVIEAIKKLAPGQMAPITKPIRRRDLLALPHRAWNETKRYDLIYIVPTGRKHDSGWMVIAIVGCNFEDKQIVGEIAAYCDDVTWSFPLEHPSLRTDCEYPAGIMRFWASSKRYFTARFEVGLSLSSTDVELVIEMQGKTP